MKIKLHVAFVGLALAMSLGVLPNLFAADDGAPPVKDHTTKTDTDPSGGRGTVTPRAAIPEWDKLAKAWEKANVGVELKFKKSKEIDPADVSKDKDKEFVFKIADEAERTKVVAWMKGLKDYRMLLSTCLASKTDPSLRAMEEILDEWAKELYTATGDDLSSAKGEVKERRLLAYGLVLQEFAKQRDSRLRVLEKAKESDTKALGFMTKTIDLVTNGKFADKTAIGKYSLDVAKKDAAVKDIMDKWKGAEREITRRERDGLGSCNFDGAPSGTPTPTPSKTATPTGSTTPTPVPGKTVSPAPPIGGNTPVPGTTPTPGVTPTADPNQPTQAPPPPPTTGQPPTGFNPNDFGQNQVNGLNDPFANILKDEAERAKRQADDALRAIQDALNGLRAQQAADRRDDRDDKDTPIIIPPQQQASNPPPPPAPIIPPSGDGGGKGAQPVPPTPPQQAQEQGPPPPPLPPPPPPANNNNGPSPIFVPADNGKMFEDDTRKGQAAPWYNQPWGGVANIGQLMAPWFRGAQAPTVAPTTGSGGTTLAKRPPGRIRPNPGLTRGGVPTRLSSGVATSAPIGRVPQARTNTVPSGVVTRGRLGR